MKFYACLSLIITFSSLVLAGDFGLTYEIQPQYTGYTDMLDCPLPLDTPLVLKDSNGNDVEPRERWPNTILILVGGDEATLQDPARIRFMAQWALQAEDAVKSVPVLFPDSKSRERLPDDFDGLIENTKNGLAKLSTSNAGRGRYPTVIFDQHGQVVFRQASVVFPQETVELIIKRMVDPEFDAQIRREFPERSRVLPAVEETDEGCISLMISLFIPMKKT